MDHFNAMLRDQVTKVWWRQENGEAIAGPLKGHFLDELPSTAGHSQIVDSAAPENNDYAT
jgi:hypothetical protein